MKQPEEEKEKQDASPNITPKPKKESLGKAFQTTIAEAQRDVLTNTTAISDTISSGKMLSS